MNPPNNSNSPTTFYPVSNRHSFFYNPPNDPQVYNVRCEEVTPFEVALQLYTNDNNVIQNHINKHEFPFFKLDEGKCYRITCELVLPSSIVRYLNSNIHGVEIRQNNYQQQEYVEFSEQLKRNLEFHLQQFLINYL